MNNDNLARDFNRRYRLQQERPKKLPFADVSAFRRLLMLEWAEHFPDTPYESDFMKRTQCHPNALTEGYIERRKEGVEIVLYGPAADGRTIWLVWTLPHFGVATLTSKTEVLPGEVGYVRPACASMAANSTETKFSDVGGGR